MSGREKLWVLVSLVLAGALIWSVVSQPVPPEPAPPPVSAPPPVGGQLTDQGINLKYNQTANDQCAEEQSDCVEVLPAAVWKEWPDGKNSGKPKRVKWWVDNAQKKQYYWEIVFKGPAGQDYLGPVDAIDCKGRQWTRTSKIAKSDEVPAGDLEWLYKVTVYSCDDNGVQDQCLCQSDPRVHIQD